MIWYAPPSVSVLDIHGERVIGSSWLKDNANEESLHNEMIYEFKGKHPGGKEGQDVHIYSDSDLAGFVDMVLKSMDKDNDGFINWMEYKRSEVAKNVADDRRN